MKVKDLQKAKSLQKTRNMGQKRVKKVIFKKTKEQFFRERRQKDWMKVAGFLSRRGFPGDLVSKAMNSIAPD
jgi:SOS response regulatory protein OraA/RecX